MATWAEFANESNDVAAAGRRMIYRTETGEALLATVRGQEPPRIHPIWVSIIDGRLYAFILASAKRRDLLEDGRYAMHTHIDPASPSEFSVRGHARLIAAPDVRAGVGGQWYFDVDDSYDLFEFSIEWAVLGVRETAEEWPPRYTSWRSAAPL
ncbi:MAG: pyridoxamine 5'-phosphate oxidase family protein [Candidatus Limnocylindrales bacterium]